MNAGRPLPWLRAAGAPGEAGALSPLAAPQGAAADFFSQASAKLAGQVSAVEGQALSAVAQWGSDAKSAVLAQLDPQMLSIGELAVQGVQTVAQGGGLTPETFAAVAGLAFGAVGGPVAGALAASMVATVQVMGQAVMSVFRLLGLAASSPGIDADWLGGWVYRGQMIPNGPRDHGDGTWARPGWQSTWAQVQAIAQQGHFRQCPAFLRGPYSGFILDDLKGFKLPTGVNQPAVSSDKWAGPYCEYQAAPAGDFLRFFVPLLYANFDQLYNLQPMRTVPAQALLAHAANLWNSAHAPGTPRVYRAEPFAWGTFTSVVSAIMAGWWTMDDEQGQPQSMNDLPIHTGPLNPRRVVQLRLHIAAPADAPGRGANEVTLSNLAPAPGAWQTPAMVAVGGAAVAAIAWPAAARALLARIGLAL